jgi:hypothetical protein
LLFISLDFYKSWVLTLSWKIVLHPEVAAWLQGLDERCHSACDRSLGLLSTSGPQLSRPHVDHVKGSGLGHLKELRVACPPGRRIRMLFAFDPERRAIVLVAGDKKGEWNKWYPRQIRLAEQRYLQHLSKPGPSGQTTLQEPENI